MPLSDNRMPTLRASTRCRTSTPRERPTVLQGSRRADDLPAHVVLLGQLHPLRHGPEEGSGRRAGHRLADGRQEDGRASPPRTSAAAPTASSRAARVRRQDGRHRRRAPDRRADGGGVHPGARPRPSATTRCRRRRFRSFGFPGADDLGNMFQVNRDFAAELNTTRDVARSKRLDPALQDFTHGWRTMPATFRSTRCTSNAIGRRAELSASETPRADALSRQG